jgi:hypothetical protein
MRFSRPGRSAGWTESGRLTAVHGPGRCSLTAGPSQICAYIGKSHIPRIVLLRECGPERMPDPHTAGALSHDPRLDDMVLLYAGKSQTFYARWPPAGPDRTPARQPDWVPDRRRESGKVSRKISGKISDPTMVPGRRRFPEQVRPTRSTPPLRWRAFGAPPSSSPNSVIHPAV